MPCQQQTKSCYHPHVCRVLTTDKTHVIRNGRILTAMTSLNVCRFREHFKLAILLYGFNVYIPKN